MKDWRQEVSIEKKLKDQKGTIWDMLEELKSMRDGKLGWLNQVQHRIEITDPQVRSFHYTLWKEGTKAIGFEKKYIKKMLRIGVVKTANTDWNRPIVFIAKKDRAQRFFIYYRKKKQWPLGTRIRYRTWKSSSIPLEMRRYSLRCT